MTTQATDGLDPAGKLKGVHPDLVKVLRLTPQAPQPFRVVFGPRTIAEQATALKTGHSQTMHSRHLADKRYATAEFPDGLAMAIDFAVLVDGKVNWKVANKAGGAYAIAAAQIMSTAKRLGVVIQWGGLEVGAWVDGQVSHYRDWGHIQLDPSAYPE